jgi:hypothetical protein
LRHFKAEQKRFLRNEPDASYFYLSAVLSAARSVGDYAISEGGKQYKEWWDQRKSKLTFDETLQLKFCNDQRVNEVHVLGADTTTSTEEFSEFEYRRQRALSDGEIEVQGSRIVGMPPAIQVYYRQKLKFREKKFADVVATCEQWLKLSESILDEFEAGNA